MPTDDEYLTPFPHREIRAARPALRPAVEAAPEVARGRPMAPQDRKVVTKVALSGLESGFGLLRS